jgi:hypothetical protein
MSRICKIIVVCEDWRHSAFARGFLTAAGVDERTLDPRVNPGGSGHDWVRDQFVAEIANLKRFSEGRGVLGLLDEDGRGVAARELELAALLKARGLLPIAAHEGRCLLLPTRNIETWIYWLAGQRNKAPVVVDEITDYKKGLPMSARRSLDKDCRPAGAHFHKLNHAQAPQGCPPMLTQALGHLRDFLNAVRRP